MITAKFNTVSNAWEIQNSGDNLGKIHVQLGFSYAGSTLDLSGLVVEITDCPKFENRISTDQEIVENYSISIDPDESKTLTFNCGGVQSQITVVGSRPENPDDSKFIWDAVTKIWVLTDAESIKDEARKALAESDEKMARVIEDIIDHLDILSSLPQTVQDIITERKTERAKL